MKESCNSKMLVSHIPGAGCFRESASFRATATVARKGRNCELLNFTEETDLRPDWCDLCDLFLFVSLLCSAFALPDRSGSHPSVLRRSRAVGSGSKMGTGCDSVSDAGSTFASSASSCRASRCQLRPGFAFAQRICYGFHLWLFCSATASGTTFWASFAVAATIDFGLQWWRQQA